MIKNHWYIACRSKQLGKRPLARTICSEPIVIFRDRKGKVGALIDRCLHRNMALSRGCVREKGLECSYHGWVYNADGNCIDIPSSCTNENFNVGRARSYPAIEKQGLVWVYVGARSTDLPMKDPIDFPRFDSAGWRHWFMERVFEGNAFHCVENFLDVPHTAHVHRGLFRGKIRKEVEIKITSGEDWVQAEFLDEDRMESLIGRLLVPKDQEITHTDKFMLPYVTRVDYRMAENRQYIVMSQCTPIDDNHTRIFTYMGYRFSPFGSMLGLIFRPLSSMILKQDIVIIKKQTLDIRRTGPKKFLYHETDAIASGIRDLIEGRSLANKEPEQRKLKI